MHLRITFPSRRIGAAGILALLACLSLVASAHAAGTPRERLTSHRHRVHRAAATRHPHETARERDRERDRERERRRHRRPPASPGTTTPAAPAATTPVTAADPTGSSASTPSSSTPPSPTASPAPSTPASPAERVIPIGTAVNANDLFGSDPLYAQTLDANFDAITPEWDMKWDHIEPEEGQWNFGPADEIVNYALAHGMTVHGHCLVWGEELPSWVSNGTWTAATLGAALKTFIQTEVTHFAGRVNEWDVVNEPFQNDGSYTQNIFYDVMGPSYIEDAFQWAHEADPSATLFINDYDIDWPGPKEQATVALAQRLLAEGIPLGGIGMEEHLSLSWSPSPAQLAQAMSDFAALGLKIEITEADVDTTGYQGTTAEAQAAQAQVFGELAAACRAQPACVRFTVWGVSDAVSWLGVAAAGLPFDANYLPTPSWTAILAGLDNPSTQS